MSRSGKTRARFNLVIVTASRRASQQAAVTTAAVPEAWPAAGAGHCSRHRAQPPGERPRLQPSPSPRAPAPGITAAPRKRLK